MNETDMMTALIASKIIEILALAILFIIIALISGKR